MSETTPPPPKRNPLQRMPSPTLPPSPRSRKAQGLTAAAAVGRFDLQKCEACGHFTYPPRDSCPRCFAADLAFAEAPRGGLIVSETTLHAPADVYFRERAPWRIGLVHLDCGPVVVAHLHGDCRDGMRTELSLQLDKAGQAVLFARPEGVVMDADDRQWREFSADPKGRRILVTDGRSAVGRAMVAALLCAGARSVHVGISEIWKPITDETALRADLAVRLVPLDLSDERSVADVATDLGGRVDILVNTADFVRPGGLTDRRGASIFQAEIAALYMGMVHLAQAFAPAMRARGGTGGGAGTGGAVAWVNVLSVHALAAHAGYGAHSAAQAACLSLSHTLRAELRQGGVRLMNVFCGPVDDEWFQPVPPPKLAPGAVAAATVAGLREGREEVFVGDVANDVMRRLASNPKGSERELS